LNKFLYNSQAKAGERNDSKLVWTLVGLGELFNCSGYHSLL